MIWLAAALIASCTTQQTEDSSKTSQVNILLSTNYGDITIELSDSTPQHRDNFIALTREGAFDSLLFHRVINQFMIQGGDPDSKYASNEDTLGGGGRDYKVPAEFHPDLFHRRGALGAARDGNIERASSSMQFYIVQRGPRQDSLINKDEKRINGWLSENYVRQDSSNAFLLDAIKIAYDTKDTGMYKWATDSIVALADAANLPWYSIPEAHREVYRTVGGSPHLDQNYTVFGQVIDGMSVVDAIAKLETNSLDRPIADVRILSATVMQ